MAPDEYAELRRWLEKLERRLDELDRERMPELLGKGLAWHSSMLTALASNDKHIASLPAQLDDRYVLRREADERRSETTSRMVALETRHDACMSRREGEEQHRTTQEGLRVVRTQVEAFQHEHQADHRKDAEAHQKVHDRAQDEHQRLLYWILGAYAAIVLMLANAVLHIIPDGH